VVLGLAGVAALVVLAVAGVTAATAVLVTGAAVVGMIVLGSVMGGRRTPNRAPYGAGGAEGGEPDADGGARPRADGGQAER